MPLILLFISTTYISQFLLWEYLHRYKKRPLDIVTYRQHVVYFTLTGISLLQIFISYRMPWRAGVDITYILVFLILASLPYRIAQSQKKPLPQTVQKILLLIAVSCLYLTIPDFIRHILFDVSSCTRENAPLGFAGLSMDPGPVDFWSTLFGGTPYCLSYT